MTSCQAFNCTNEKGKCEKNFFFFVITDRDYCTLVYTSTIDHEQPRECTTAIGDKKEKRICTHKTS